MIGALGLALACGSASAQLAPDESRFLQFIIQDLRALATAERYIATRLARAAGGARADLEYFQADIQKLKGDAALFEERIKELASKYPNHPRSGTASLSVLLSRMNEVGRLADEAAREPDAARKAALRAEAKKLFTGEVLPGFDSLLESLRRQVKGAPAKAEGKKPDDRLFDLYAAEFNRIHVIWVYQNLLDREAEKAEREALLKRGLAEASAFVDTRYVFFLFRYRAQLYRGRFLAELGRIEEAAETFETLVDIEPPGGKGTTEVEREILDIRIQAHLYSTQCFIRARRFEDAVEISRRALEDRRILKGIEEPAHRDLGVQLLLQRGVALAGVGREREGAEVILGLIRKYEELCQKNDRKACDYVVDAQGALGEMVEIALASFPPAVLHQAGRGLMTRYAWPRARAMFHRALARIEKGEEELAAQILLDLGKAWYLDGALRESCFSYLLVDRLGKGELTRSDGAQGALAAAQKLAPEGKASQSIYAWAADFFVRDGSGYAAELQKLIDGREAFEKREYAQAREKFLSVQPTYQQRGEAKKTDFHLRAQALAAYCLHLMEPKEGKGTEELRKVLQRALAAGDADGGSTAARYLGQILLDADPPKIDEAIEVLSLYDGKLATAGEARDEGLSLYAKARARKGEYDRAWAIFERLAGEYGERAAAIEASIDLGQAFGLANQPLSAARAIAWYVDNPRVKAVWEKLDVDTKLWLAGFLKDGDAGHLAKAREIFEEIWNRKPEDANTRLAAGLGVLAIAVRLQKDLDRAIEIGEDLKKGLASPGTGPLDTDLFYELANAYVLRAGKAGPGRGRDLAEAERNYVTAIGYLQYRIPIGKKYENQYWEAYVRLFRVFNQRKQWGQTVTFYKGLERYGLPEDPKLADALRKLYEEAAKSGGIKR